MNKEELADLLKFTYEKTVNDNKDDFLKLFKILTTICIYLKAKNILTENDVKDILNIDNED